MYICIYIIYIQAYVCVYIYTHAYIHTYEHFYGPEGVRASLGLQEVDPNEPAIPLGPGSGPRKFQVCYNIVTLLTY